MDGKRDVWQTVKVIEEALDLLDHNCASTMTEAQVLDAMRAVRRLADRMGAEAAVWTAGPAGPRESSGRQDLRGGEDHRYTPVRLPGAAPRHSPTTSTSPPAASWPTRRPAAPRSGGPML